MNNDNKPKVYGENKVIIHELKNFQEIVFDEKANKIYEKQNQKQNQIQISLTYLIDDSWALFSNFLVQKLKNSITGEDKKKFIDRLIKKE